MSRGRLFLAAGVLACAPAWAVSESDRLPMVYEPPVPAKALPNVPVTQVAPAAVIPGCSLRVRSAEDARRNKDTVGAWMFLMEAVPTSVPIFGQSVFSGDGTKWLRGAVQTLPTLGVPLQENSAREVDLQLRLAHTWVPGFNMTAHVVLEARYSTLGDRAKRYHGFGTKLNWANGKAEFMETLNLAMHDALKGLADDVQAMCAGRMIAGFAVQARGESGAVGIAIEAQPTASTIAAATQAAMSVPPSVATAPATATAPVRATPAAPRSETAALVNLRRGDSFTYVVTDRATGRAQTVQLRADRVDEAQVTFNGGARVEKLSGEVMRLESAMAGEMDFATPPGGWMAGGRQPQGNWSMDYASSIPGSKLRYELRASADREQLLRTAAGDFRAVRIDLRGWVENANGHNPMRARYEASAWFAPELRRVIRFEARARSAGNSGASFFQVDEVAELTRIDRD